MPDLGWGEAWECSVASRQVAAGVVLFGSGRELVEAEEVADPLRVLLGEPDLLGGESRWVHVVDEVCVVCGENDLGAVRIDVRVGEHGDQHLCQLRMETGVEFVDAQHPAAAKLCQGRDRQAEPHEGSRALGVQLQGVGPVDPEVVESQGATKLKDQLLELVGLQDQVGGTVRCVILQGLGLRRVGGRAEVHQEFLEVLGKFPFAHLRITDPDVGHAQQRDEIVCLATPLGQLSRELSKTFLPCLLGVGHELDPPDDLAGQLLELLVFCGEGAGQHQLPGAGDPAQERGAAAQPASHLDVAAVPVEECRGFRRPITPEPLLGDLVLGEAETVLVTDVVNNEVQDEGRGPVGGLGVQQERPSGQLRVSRPGGC